MTGKQSGPSKSDGRAGNGEGRDGRKEDGRKRSAPRVLSAGHVNWDVTMHVSALPEPDGEVVIDRLVQSGGGSAANVAAGLVGLDTPAAVYGSVGGDESGAMALRELERAGVDPGHVLIDSAGTTSVKYLVVDDTGEVMVFSNEGANESFTADEIDPSVLRSVEQLHLTSQAPETAVTLAEIARAAKIPVSFDPGRRVDERGFDEVLQEIDLLFVNEREARLIDESGTVSTENPEDFVTVVKRGCDGADVRTPNGTISHPGFEVDAIDRTGAGDAFAAGFTAALFDCGVHDALRSDGRGFDPETYRHPLAVGNACGALTTKEVTARVPLSWADVDALIGIREERADA